MASPLRPPTGFRSTFSEDLSFTRQGSQVQTLLRPLCQHQLTNFGRESVVRDFYISPDGREIALDRVQENSEIVLVDLAAR